MWVEGAALAWLMCRCLVTVCGADDCFLILLAEVVNLFLDIWVVKLCEIESTHAQGKVEVDHGPKDQNYCKQDDAPLHFVTLNEIHVVLVHVYDVA